MAGRLLILSFHNAQRPGVSRSLLGEDLRFKRGALVSRLIDTDAMDDARPPDGSLFDALRPGSYSGIERGEIAEGPTHLLGLNPLGANAWAQPGFRRRPDPAAPGRLLPSLFEEWISGVFSRPVDVLVLAGHHQGGLVWGAKDRRVKWHRWFTALVTGVVADEAGRRRSLLEFQGHALNPKPGGKDLPELRAGTFDLTPTLARCRLLVLLGCNGAVPGVAPLRRWIANAAGRPPFILGWYGTHEFPADQVGNHVSPHFWRRLDALAPGDDLTFLHDPAFARRIAEAWAAAVRDAFGANPGQRHLLFARDRREGPRGAGAIDPAGTIWRVVDTAGTVRESGQMPEEGA